MNELEPKTDGGSLERTVVCRFLSTACVVLLAAACASSGGAPAPSTPEPAAVGARQVNSTEQSESPDKVSEQPKPAEEAHEHTAAQADHGAHMESVRAMLKEKLGKSYDAPLGPVSADVAAGKRIYAERCANCHGPTGKGDGPSAAALASAPSDLTDGEHSRFYSDQGRLYIVRHGIPNTPMAGFLDRLGEKDTLGVYAYVRTLAPDSKKDHGHGPGAHDHDKGHDHGSHKHAE